MEALQRGGGRTSGLTDLHGLLENAPSFSCQVREVRRIKAREEELELLKHHEEKVCLHVSLLFLTNILH